MHLAEAVRGWGASYSAMKHDVHVREVNAGGNYILTAIPTAMQAVWTGAMVGEVGRASQGALKGTSSLLAWGFSPFVMVPSTLLAAAIREGFYESSIDVPLPGQVKHYALGERAVGARRGALALQVGGVTRHFQIKEDVTWIVENSTDIVQNGQRKWFHYHIIRPDSVVRPDEQDRVREIMINGTLTRVVVSKYWETTKEVEESVRMVVNGRTYHYTLGREVSEPAPPTVTVMEQRHGIEVPTPYFLGPESPVPVAGGVTVTVPDQTSHYEVSKEQAAPSEKTRTFTINGRERHFLNVKSTDRHTYGVAEIVNRIPRLPFRLPRNLSIRQVAAGKFIAEHFSKVLRVITAVACATLFLLGQYYVAGAILAAIVYRVVDHDLGWIPRKISLFMERWMPTVSLVGLLFVGSFMTQVFSVAALACTIPSVKQKVHQTVDKWCLSHIYPPVLEVVIKTLATMQRVRGRDVNTDRDIEEMRKALLKVPRLEEFDAPLVTQNEMTFAQIDAFLRLTPEQLLDRYQINPAHCSVSAEPLHRWPEDSRFDRLVELWDANASRFESTAYNTLFLKALDDDRFWKDTLQPRFPEAKMFHYDRNLDLDTMQNIQLERQQRTQHREQFEGYITTLAREKGLTKEKFLAQWTRQQLVDFVERLKGAKVIDGPQMLLQDAIDNTARIIPFLDNATTTPLDRESALIKLAVEGGKYCTLAMRRASEEVLEGFTEPVLTAELENGAGDPIQRRETQIRFALQKARHQMFQNYYREAAGFMSHSESTKATFADVHLYTAFMRMFQRGFYPMKPSDIREFGSTELMLYETVGAALRVQLFGRYMEQMTRVMTEMGRNPRGESDRILDNLRAWVQQNPALTPEERTTLLAGPLADSADNRADFEFYPRVYALQLVKMGVLREKPQSATTQVA